MRALLVTSLIAIAACDAGFDDPKIVKDLRVLGVKAEPPEVVLDFDLAHPDLSQLDIPPVTFTALVADPGADRRVVWSLSACPALVESTCPEGDPATIVFASGVAEDPDGAGAGTITGTITVDVMMLRAALEADSQHGAAGIPVAITLRVASEDGGEVAYAFKRERYTARIPEERVANSNPHISEVDADDAPLADGTCLPVTAGEQVNLLPIAPEEDAETYVLPTLDGGSRTFTEALDYSWYVTAGELSDGHTGGRTPLDMDPPDDTDWTAPQEHGTVTLWLIQRDGRGGMSWTERCFDVQ